MSSLYVTIKAIVSKYVLDFKLVIIVSFLNIKLKKFILVLFKAEWNGVFGIVNSFVKSLSINLFGEENNLSNK